MAKRTAFCLVENKKGQVLLVQLAYGKKKCRWSLPGGLVNHGERSIDAARRETLEETGFHVQIDGFIMENPSRKTKAFHGKIVGGHLKKYQKQDQKQECLDARFFDPNKLPRLAHRGSGGKRAIRLWQEKKEQKLGMEKDGGKSGVLGNLFSSKQDQKSQTDEWEVIGTRFYGEEDFENVPPWIQKQVQNLCAKGLGNTPKDLTHEFRGKTFLYRLDFDGPDGDILGVYRKLKDESAPIQKSATQKEIPSPSWEIIGRSVNSVTTGFDRVPDWIQRKIAYIRKNGPGSSLGGQTYRIKGKRYRYKLQFAGQGGVILVVSRKPRTWYWKKLNGLA